jgi:hypothetical protein
MGDQKQPPTPPPQPQVVPEERGARRDASASDISIERRLRRHRRRRNRAPDTEDGLSSRNLQAFITTSPGLAVDPRSQTRIRCFFLRVRQVQFWFFCFF